MNLAELGVLAAAGGLGAGVRYLVDAAVMRGRSDAFPLGILLVNVIGSLVLGVIVGAGASFAPVWGMVVGVGLLGGFTTFSTVSVDSALMAQRGRRDWAVVNLIATLGTAVVAAAIGMVIGGLLPR
ncbi:CrcB family protein [Microbacterium sp. zg.Y1090]|uniref:fluoride efflux transporter FluC n=1 Tax=Microbacterium TaxID=33882 RepID=UPI00214B151C|nr:MULTISPECIES: CrcB family protein [unclassified Microbacterium]MCR2813126.1 CrcB family protein [Microbacterium sp. zg.Y1084]MCR2819439.1 CrcB family protein [Microbacterium sp. zg.Y1090]WIM28415.1 CrcB family protein [Microbacterium sp. zg-Y1090]